MTLVEFDYRTLQSHGILGLGVVNPEMDFELVLLYTLSLCTQHKSKVGIFVVSSMWNKAVV